MRRRWASSRRCWPSELGQPLLELGLDATDGSGHPLVRGHVVGCRPDGQIVERGQALAGQWVDGGDGLDLVAEQLDADQELLVGRVDLDRVTPHPELAPDQVHVVPLVLHVDELGQDRSLVVLLARLQHEELLAVLLW